jgi:TfoX/Sxy family transcriptional regulator of competence genes
MAYDEDLADRIRGLVAMRDGYSERKMFGGLCFMLHGNMFAGVVHDDLMLRVGKEGFDAALQRPAVRPMDFTGRPMTNMVYIAPSGIATDAALRGWLDEALAYVDTIPPKAAKAAKPRPARSKRVTK